MRRIPVLLTALGLLCWLTACSTTDDPRAQPGGSPPPAGSGPAVPSPPAGTGSVVPSPPAGTGSAPVPASPPAGSVGPPAPPQPGGGEVPGPLPFGERTLTGTVERVGDCTMLLVGERRWALTGDAAATLRPGSRVTVRGAVAPLPPACADRDLAQTVAVARVEPA
ncbi:hypothetical protein [Micromonospora sp. NPDC049497]|uniref:hypothetical protein n=1 Tax=Micromonospora sp. NPDC049497 TaxID=3364273 RepID=UPI0037BC2154